MAQDLEHKQWTGRTSGTSWMLKSLILGFKVLPLWFYYTTVAMVIPFYMLFHRKAYKSTFRFYRTAFRFSRLKSFVYVYRNQFKFGQVIIDRFAKYAGKSFNINIENEELFNQLSAQEGSFVILSAHVGNYEMAGYTFRSNRKPINALAYAKEVETVMSNRQSQFSNTNIRMISVKEDMSHLFEINNAFCNGEIVSIPADRLFGSTKYVECDFFGKKAKLPTGPFATISQRDLPAIAVFVMKSGYRSYDAKVISLTDNIPEELKRNQKIELLAQRFADTIEDILRQYPTQWFNYYDFWS